jgi:thiosulfate/3-mercaptopyruvate sulfurtransferase
MGAVPHRTARRDDMTTMTSSALLGTAELAADLGVWAGSPDRRILEVDEDTDAYARGHLPGALAVHWRDDLQDPGRRDFIGPEAFAALMDRLGVGNDTQVVLYGGNSNWFAAYAYWYFRFYGHRAVRLLDGGRKTWELESPPSPPRSRSQPRATATGSGGRSRRSGPCAPRFSRPSGAATARPWSTSAPPEEYRGEVMAPPHLPQEVAQRPGHIPGAANVPRARAVDPEKGTFLRAGQLRSLYEGQGLTPDREVIAYCRIGERSPTPGSCCTSCSATPGSATTTAPGPSGAAWSGPG